MTEGDLAQFLGRQIIVIVTTLLSLNASWSWEIKSMGVAAEGLLPQIKQEMADLKASQQQWIEVDLSEQKLIAWEGKRQVYQAIISTGKKATPTRPGVFAILSKHRLDRMRGDDYDIADVPHAMYYYGGYAIHGAYWHDSFGTPVSHGCINLPIGDAQWLFNWASVGTAVVIHD